MKFQELISYYRVVVDHAGQQLMSGIRNPSRFRAAGMCLALLILTGLYAAEVRRRQVVLSKDSICRT